MMKIYEKIEKISFYSINSRLMLTNTNLARFLQDTAIEHSEKLGYTVEKLISENKGWIVTNWHIIIEKMPRFGDEIKIKTWVKSCRRLMSDRYFVVEDSNGNEIVKAASRWVFMDLVERKPCIIPKEMEEEYHSNMKPSIENEKYHMPKTKKEFYDSMVNIEVARSQTDTNGHTNNTQYILWAMDQVPDEIYNNMNCYDLKVVYRKESYKGCKIGIKTYIEDIGNEKIINIFIQDIEDEKIVYAQISTLWRK